MTQRVALSVLFVCVLAVHSAFAQNWSFDARRIGMGSTSGGENLASRMIEEERRYRSIVLPFGLIQVFRDFDRIKPNLDNDEFDLVRMVEYLAAPLHYTIGRDTSDTKADDFITDISEGRLSRDLNEYKGFIPVNQPPAAGLAAPNWGKTFRVRSAADGSFHGVYVGGGPYVYMRTASAIDDRLTQILSPGPAVYLPLAQLPAENNTRGELALAIAGGYRGRFAWPGGGGGARDGVYVAANYNYLHGFSYQELDMQLRLDTDRSGLITVNPLLPPPLFVSHTSAESGRGMAIDVGIGAVVDNWELGFGANGLANRITWSDAERTSYFHASLLAGGGDLTEGVTVPLGDLRVELPIDYRANVGYDVGAWAAMAEFGRGYQGTSFHGGGELRLGLVDVRGGGVYSRELWNPAGGVGLNLSERVALDVAIYSNSANVERKRNPAIAVSLRLNQ